MRKRFLILLVLGLFLASHGAAWGTYSHTWVSDELLSKPKDNNILEMCGKNEQNRRAFYAGSVIPDITVVYYYASGGAKYKATHNWNFQQEVMNRAQTDDERCFAYGIAQHLTSDSIAHQDTVPRVIRQTTIPNWLIHPLTEQKYDTQIAQQYEVENQTEHVLYAVTAGEKSNRYIEMMENSLGTNNQINVEKLTQKLSVATGQDFYDQQFNPDGSGGIFALYPYIQKVSKALHPIVSRTRFGSFDKAMSKTVEQNRNIYNNWGARYELSPHGFRSLRSANQEASQLFNIIIAVILLASFVVPVGLVFYTGKLRYAATVFIGIGLLILLFVGIYIWV